MAWPVTKEQASSEGKSRTMEPNGTD